MSQDLNEACNHNVLQKMTTGCKHIDFTEKIDYSGCDHIDFTKKYLITMAVII